MHLNHQLPHLPVSATPLPNFEVVDLENRHCLLVHKKKMRRYLLHTLVVPLEITSVRLPQLGSTRAASSS